MQTFTAISSNGELEWVDPERLKQFLIMTPGNMVVNIGKERRTRSNKQNRYAYGIALQTLSDHTGYSIEEIKQVVKKEFGWTKILEVNGKTFEVLVSTTEMDTVQFEKFMSQVRMLGSALGCYIPEPNSPHFALTD